MGEKHKGNGEGNSKGPENVDKDEEEYFEVDTWLHQGCTIFTTHLGCCLTTMIKVQINVLWLHSYARRNLWSLINHLFFRCVYFSFSIVIVSQDIYLPFHALDKSSR